MNDNEFQARLHGIAALEEPLRRDLYLYVAGQAGEVSRDQAAEALRISRSLAAFHLDRLVEAGLLEATFRRLSERRGPGAGRPSKLYRRAERAIEISIPQRRYELAGQLMSRALSEAESETSRAALRHAAHDWGRKLGAESIGAAKTGAHPAAPLDRAAEALRGVGFEPLRNGGDEISLRNCPFDALARGSQEVICGMNLALIEGMIEGLGVDGVEARLEPQPGRCCVVVRKSGLHS